MATSTPPPAEPSYTEMDAGDVEAIGAHCQYTYCRQLDFLPFKCLSCGHKFCGEHRTEDAHKCTHAGEFARSRRKNETTSSTIPSAQKPTVQTAQQCSEPQCKTFVNTSQNLGVHCQTCNRTYCLKHRMREDHDCKNLTPLGARPVDVAYQANKEKIRVGFNRLRVWGKEKQEDLLRPKPPKPTSRAAQLAALNALKRTAKGDAKIPADKRIYLHCEGVARDPTAKQPKADLFFSADWPIGKLLDVAAKELKMGNANNSAQKEDDILRVFHIESNAVLDFKEKVGQRLADGNSIFILRGVGPADLNMGS